jgi:ActR/RegA family two-component response regulator
MTFVCHVTSTKSHCVAPTYFAVFTLYAQPSAERIEGHAMSLDLFSRKLVLLVEDEPLIALDIEHRLRSEGARVITAGHLDAALYMAEHPDLSGAVVDLYLGAESATPIFRRLTHRKLPFVVHTGYATEALAREWPSAAIVQKPASLDEITDALAQSLLAAHLLPSSNALNPLRVPDTSSTAQ